MKHLRQFENQQTEDEKELEEMYPYGHEHPDMDKMVKLSDVEDVLVEALMNDEIDMKSVSIEELIYQIAFYPKYSKEIKKYNL